MARKLHEIAAEIRADWRKPSGYAQPYLDAMGELLTMQDKFYLDSADEIVARFLANAGAWRGEVARKIKAELNAMLAEPSA